MPYKMPPKAIADLIDAPQTPVISLDPAHHNMLLMHRSGLPSIEELSRPELRLAGLRIDPENNGPSRMSFYNGLTFKRFADGQERVVVGLPEGSCIGQAHWSPNGKYIAFTVTDHQGIFLWVASVDDGVARPLADVQINGVLGAPFMWMPDSLGLLVRTVCADRGKPPEAPRVPDGPVIQENAGVTAPSRTYQDLLKNAHDEALFVFYGQTQTALVGLDGKVKKLGPVGLICRAEPSPDGCYVLVESIHKPFSYLVPFYRFPTRVEIWNANGQVVCTLADLPLSEAVPIAFDAVPAGPRAYGWRADAGATVTWVTAQDGGDPAVDVPIRDIVYALDAPFQDEGTPVMQLSLRYAGRTWGKSDLALVSERWWKTRRVRTYRICPDDLSVAPQVMFDRSWEDRYSDPGVPLLERNESNRRVLQISADGRFLFFAGEGASPEGDRPFLDRYDIETGKTERLLHSEAPFYERPVVLLDTETLEVITSRETVNEPANYFVRNLTLGTMTQVTHFPHPTPQLKDVQKELIRYPRKDGVQLTATLYLPPGYKVEDGPLPLVMWAYPREFKSADAAGQVKDSPCRFVRVSPQSALPFLLCGFAVLDGPTMPIVGEGEDEANDTYLAQLTDSAQAAVDEVVRRGVADAKRIVVGGHSYGGFMTANLLAHSHLFCCGIARSGAYNRTLTPFGFQAEERTLWQAPEVYAAMSPFMHVPKIKAPILLIHGEADNNSGTFPMQSERFYNALKGHGAVCRLVMLPHESHGYQARESVLHMWWEMVMWLDKYANGNL
jgi:dipeptidyl aminopeptidase/acylaminoacyl peptidase